MSIYLVTSGVFTVTKDGTPLGGSPYSDDVAALQAAHDDAVDDDTIQLKQGASAFDMSVGAAQLAITKQLNFEGVDGKPILEDGTVTFYANATGKNLSFKNLTFKNSSEIALNVWKANDISLESVDVEQDTCSGRTRLTTAGEPLFMGVLLGNSSSFGIFDGAITGNITIDGSVMDMEKGADPADPYAGARSVLNPSHTSDTPAGPWPGAGSVTPGTWLSLPIHVSVGPENKKTNVKNCLLQNYSFAGMAGADNQGLFETERNTITTPYGAHSGGSGIGSTGLACLNAVAGFIANIPELRKPHGNWQHQHNSIVLKGKRLVGMYAIVHVGGPFKPKSAVLTKNLVVHEDTGLFGIWISGTDLGYVGQNKVLGSGSFGIQAGFTTPFRLWGTDKVAIVGNNLQNYTPAVADLRFTIDSAECAAAGGFAGETVLDQGVDNIVTGRDAPLGAIGTLLQEILDNLKDQDML